MISGYANISFDDDDLVIGVYINGEARAYPHRIFWWHEIVNDIVGGKEIAVSYCPLTGTGITYDRNIAGSVRTFGVSGILYNNNLVMYDRVSNTLFPQMCPKGLADPLKNVQLEYVPSTETTWGTWKKMHPNTTIISFDTGYSRSYNHYPYNDYITNHNYILFGLSLDDGRLNRKDMVFGIINGNEAKVYPFKLMDEHATINDVIGDLNTLIVYDENSKMAVAFNRTIDSQTLSFRVGNVPGSDGLPFDIIDNQTGSTWNLFGEAISGPMEGDMLEQVATAYSGFWFSFGAFFPDIEIVNESVLTGIDEPEDLIPENFRLEQNHPNPFNAVTTLRFHLKHEGNISLIIYNILGQKLRTITTGYFLPGNYSVQWDGKSDSGNMLQSGVFIAQLKTSRFTGTIKMVMLK